MRLTTKHHKGHIEIHCGTKRLHLLAGKRYLHLVLKGEGITKYAKFRHPK